MKRFLTFAMGVAAFASTGVLGTLRASAPQVPSNTWLAAGDMTTARAGASATLLAGGHVLITGGVDESGAVLASAERYSPSAGAFIATSPMQAARANHTATLLPGGRVLVAGGADAAGLALASTEIYDPAANSWQAGPSMNVARRGHTATVLSDGRIVVAGGDDNSVAVDSLEIYDPASNTFTYIDARLSSVRTQHAATLLPGDKVLVAGGNNGTDALASTDIFDGKTGSVSTGATLSTPRSGLSATALLDGRVLVAGGANAGGELASAEVFDPATNSFSATNSAMSVRRQNHLAVLLPHNNQVLIVGGTAAGVPVASAEVYSPWDGGAAQAPVDPTADPTADPTTTTRTITLNNGTFCATTMCANGFAGPAMPNAARAWPAGSALSFAASAAVRSGPNDGLFLLAGGTGKSSAELYGFATVRTDKDDYAPGSVVTITGSGWKPGEWVALLLKESPALDEHPLLDVQADANGNIVSTEFVPDEHDLNVRFYLTAFGQESQAQTTFTDARNLILTFAASTGSGSVTVRPSTGTVSAPIACGGTGAVASSQTVTSTCSPNITISDNGAIVTFSASANSGSVFAGWSGQAGLSSSTCSGTTNPCSAALGGGATLTVTFDLANVATTLTLSAPSPASAPFGSTGPVALSATLTRSSGGAAVSGATIAFTVDGSSAGSATTNASGVATLSYNPSALATTSHTVQATFAQQTIGGSTFLTSTSGTETLTVTKADTTTTITNDSPDPSVTGQPVTINYSVAANAPGSGTPTGNVTVSDGTTSCTGTVAAGSCQITFTSAGPKSLTATYAGDTNFNTSTSTTAAHQVDKASTTTTITSDVPDPSVVGQAVTVQYSVTVNAPGAGTPAGNVTVSDGTTSCTGTVAAGQCSVTFTSAGAKTLTATYAGDGNFNGSTSAAETHTANKADTTTTITSDTPDPSVVGQAVTVQYSVTVTGPGAGTPTGNVTVSDGATTCTGTVSAGQCSLTFTSAGAKTLTAIYAGDSNFNGSTSATASHQVDKADATTAITGDSPDPSIVGQAVVVQYSVTSNVSGAGTPTGNVTVSDGTVSCTGTVAAGQCAMTFTAAGAKTLTATYAGDSNFNGSTSVSASHQVDKASTTTTITSDTPDPSVVGQAATIKYSVAVTSPGSGTPTGNVTVSDGTISCTGTVAAGQCDITFTSAGAKALTATYAGDGNFNGSTSAAETHTVNKADTTATITSDTPDPSVVGQSVTVQYAVTVTGPGAGTPTGNVTVSDGTFSCTGTVAAGQCDITFTSAGAKTLTAIYAGDSNFNGSASGSEAHTVSKAETTTTITSDSPDPSVVGQAVTIQYSVAVVAPAAGTPTGDVTVSDGANSCTGTVAAGQCSITLTSAGAKTLTATYAGDTNFNTSTSAAAPHQVDRANTTTAITSDSPDPSVVGQAVTIQYSVTVNAPGAGTPTGSVTVSDGTISCTGTVAAGQCNLTFTYAGARTLTASYEGDSSFNTSTSATAAHQVDKAGTTTTITSDSPDPSVVGQPVTIQYSVAVNAPGAGTPTGNVTVSDGTFSCTGTVAVGHCDITFTSAGAKTLTATYAGDSNFNGSVSAGISHTVNKADTTTTITSDSPDPSVVGQAVTVQYSVTASGAGAGTPTGNVTVSDGANSCTGTVAAGQCSITLTSAGAKTLTATYSGDSNFNTSTSATAAHQVDKANTTTTITSDTPDPSVVGEAVAVSYTVAAVAPGSGTPTGNVTVSDGTVSCTGTVAAGQCAVTFTSPGARTLTATYAGDSSFNGSASAGEGHTINKANTTTAITADAADPSVVGQQVTVNYSVAVTAPGSGTPTGNVTVSNGTTSCTAAVSAGSCQITFTTAGPHPLTATYAGDGNFNGSASASEPHAVSKATTTTAIISDNPDPSIVGQSIAVVYAVAVSAPGAGVPTGTVTVTDGVASCSATVAAGTCTLTLSIPGTRTLTATYAGDTNFNGSFGTDTHNVNYTFAGFFSPVDMAPVVNSSQAGQAIPIKWRLTDAAGVGISDPSSFGDGTTPGLTSYMSSCTGTTLDATVEEYAPGESGLLYLGNGNWQINWKTLKNYGGTCRTLVVKLRDGSAHVALFKFK